jgi:sugar O-acyltransferase (sialic acid O-acetyltransferase NeuD family)
MSKPSLILIGAGGQARACIDVVEQEGIYEIAGLIGLPQEVGNKSFGYEVIATDTQLGELVDQHQFALISIGQVQTAEHRIRLFSQAQDAGFAFPSVISPTAYVSPHASIGIGTLVMHGAIVNAGASVGKNCIINSNSLVEHDAQVEDHCHVSTGAIINGNTYIGLGSFIGSRAVIKEGISIGANSIVGMGLTVRQNVASETKFLGLAPR